METPSMGVCFIDTCIILNKILDEDSYRTNKFFNDVKNTGIDCYITPSVQEECEKKINTTLDYIGASLRTIF